jgi:hypothetical protein
MPALASDLPVLGHLGWHDGGHDGLAGDVVSQGRRRPIDVELRA